MSSYFLAFDGFHQLSIMTTLSIMTIGALMDLGYVVKMTYRWTI
jgi:hypothetical protein